MKVKKINLDFLNRLIEKILNFNQYQEITGSLITLKLLKFIINNNKSEPDIDIILSNGKKKIEDLAELKLM